MKEALNIAEKKLGEGAGERNYTTQMDAVQDVLLTEVMYARLRSLFVLESLLSVHGKEMFR